MTTQQAGEKAKALFGVSKKEHFGSDAYVANGRMFATVWHDQHKVNLRLSLQDQRKFLSLDGEAFVTINNAWGKQGWTCVQLKFIEQAQFMAALKCAWNYSAQKTPSANLKTTRAEEKKAKRQALAPVKKLQRKNLSRAKKQLAKAEILKGQPALDEMTKPTAGQNNILGNLSKENKLGRKKR
jgi:hypothetical protein